MTPYLQDADVTLYNGDCLEVLRTLPDRSVHMCATSPPFYGLRDYQVEGQIGLEESPDEWVARLVEVFREVRRVLRDDGTLWVEIGDSYRGATSQHKDRVVWEGGDETCQHEESGLDLPVSVTGVEVLDDTETDELPGTHLMPAGVLADGLAELRPHADSESDGLGGGASSLHKTSVTHSGVCSKCGARQVVHTAGFGANSVIAKKTQTGVPQSGRKERNLGMQKSGLKPKDLLGAPWLLAFALRADGWYLRSEIIWARPNPMPESVTDRPTKAHSTVFLLSKSPRYFYDQEATREPLSQISLDQIAHYEKNGEREERRPKGLDVSRGDTEGRLAARGAGSRGAAMHPAGANARSVWNIATEPTPFAHFATWPQKLCRRMIQAGTSERGVCPECGAPWVREVERTEGEDQSWSQRENPTEKESALIATGKRGGHGNLNRGDKAAYYANAAKVTTLGWRPNCDPGCTLGDQFRTQNPATVLDPFGGSGTTALVARKLGRKAILIELNEEYCELASSRLAQQSLFADVGDEEPAPVRSSKGGRGTGLTGGAYNPPGQSPHSNARPKRD